MRTVIQVSHDYKDIETMLRTGNPDSAIRILRTLAIGVNLGTSVGCKLFALYGDCIREIDEGNFKYMIKNIRVLRYAWVRALAIYDGEGS